MHITLFVYNSSQMFVCIHISSHLMLTLTEILSTEYNICRNVMCLYFKRLYMKCFIAVKLVVLVPRHL